METRFVTTPFPTSGRGAIQDLRGQTFGQLTVEEFAGKRGRLIHWRCLCACGNRTVVYRGHLIDGHTRSCGCLFAKAITKHGLHESPEYQVWEGIKDRCLNPNNTFWKYYGGRGITVCARWVESFECFLADVGNRPSKKHTIDRIDVNGNYEPGNVRWATRSQQQRNRRDSRFLEFNGQNLSVWEWAERTGLRVASIWSRIYKLGWSIEKALTTPPKGSRPNRKDAHIVEWQGEALHVRIWAERTGIPAPTIWYRVHNAGWSVEKALTTPVCKGKKQKFSLEQKALVKAWAEEKVP